MSIDVPTVLIVIAAITLFVSATLLREWRVQRGEAPELLWWAASYLLFTVGGFMAPLRLDGWDILGIGLSNALLLTGNLMVRYGIRLFAGRLFSPVWYLAGPIWLALYAGTPLLDDTGIRIIIVSAFVTIVAIANAIDLWKIRYETAAARDLSVLFAAHGAFFVVRLLVAAGPEHATGTIAFQSLFFQIALFELAVFSVIVGTYLLTMTRERAFLRIQAVSEIDFLTGIDNRRAFFRKVKQLTGEPGEPGLSLLIFDLDHFKRINDKHGHTVGDKVLKHFCRVAETYLKPGDILGRLGGEEFAILLRSGEPDVAKSRAEDVRQAFQRTVEALEGHPLSATVSAGTSTTSRPPADIAQMFEAADRALYRAKRMGRNRVEVEDCAGHVAQKGDASTPSTRHPVAAE